MKKTIYFLLLCVAGLLFSCSEDDTTKINNNQLNYQKNQISFSEFMKLEGQNPKVINIEKYFQSYHSGFLNKGSDTLNWEIDTTLINQIITSEITTYTFGVIEHDSIQGFRNVLISIKENASKVYLIHYPDGVDFENQTERVAQLEEIDSGVFQKTTCYKVVIITVSCDNTECEYGWDLVEVPCGDGGNNSGGSGSGGSSGGSGGSGSNGGGPTDPGLPTDPIGGGNSNGGGNNTSGSTFENDFLYSLPQEQFVWLNNNPTIKNQIKNYLDTYGEPSEYGWYENSDAVQFAKDYLYSEADKVCINSFVFTDVGSNWQNAGISNVNVQFLTIGNVIALQNVHFPELHFGLPKQLSNGDYITNHNARYIAQSIMSQAEQLTDAYQSINPNSTALQLKTYFLQKMQQISAEQGGTVSISAPMGWNGQLQPHQTYFITSSWECE